jgi:hypothetical protein
MKKPLQVYLDRREAASLAAWARRRGWTRSEAVRAALRALLRTDETDPLLRASGMVRGLPGDLGEQFDRYLVETFDAPSTRRPARRRRAARPVRR